MRSISRMTIFATIAIALVAAPVGLTAQSRTGGSSRNSSSSSSSATRSTSSSSASRPASSSQVNRSSGNSSSQASRSSSSSQVSRSGSSSQVNRNSGQVSRSSGSSSSQASRSSSSSQVNRSSSSSQVNRSAGSSAGQVSRSGSSSQVNRSSGSTSGQVNRSTGNTSSQVNRNSGTTGSGQAASRAGGSTRQTTGASSNLSNRNTTAVPTKGLDAVPSQPRNQAASEVAGIVARPDEPSAASRTGEGNAPDRTGTAVSRTGNTAGAPDRTGTAVSRTGGNRPQAGETMPRNYRGGDLPRGEIRMDEHRNIHRIPPREREFMPYDRPVSFYRNAYHFYGCRVSYLPASIVRRIVRGIEYYIWNNIYYRRFGETYYICRPPFGVMFSPLDYELDLVACRFSYFSNTYWTYRTINDNANLIAQQNRIIAQNNATIAAQNAAMALNLNKARKAYDLADRLGLVQSYADASVEYFYDDGVFFILNSRGQYEVIVPPAGALVSELPDDYDVITIDGVDYYKVDDTIYHLTVVDGSPYLEVLGQLTGDLSRKYNLYK